jgi:PAS domain S-box-containing protein
MLDPSVMSPEQLHAEIHQLRARVAALEGVTVPITEGLTGACAHILDHLHDAVIMTDASLQIRFWNRTAEHLYGWSRAEVIDRPVGQVVPVVRYITNEEDGTSIAAALRAQGHWRGEVVQHHRDGHEVFVDASVQSVTDAAGGQSGYLTINRDIGERLRLGSAHTYAVEDLRMSEERLRLALQASNQGLYDLDIPSGMSTVSPEYAHMLGYDPATFHETTPFWIERLHPDDALRATEAYRVCLSGETSSFAVDFRERTADDRWIWLLSLGKIITWDAQGQPLRMLGTRTDITARKQIEQALQHSVERLHILAEASRAFAEVGSEYQALLDRIVRIGADRLQAACTIRLLSDDGQSLGIVACDHYDPARLHEMQAVLVPWRIHLDDHAPAAVAAQTGEAQFMPVIDREALSATLPPEQQGILQHFSPHSVMVVPLRFHNRSIGSLMLARDSRDLPSFNTDDLALTQELADRAALAIETAMLFQQAQAEIAERKRAEETLAVERSLLAQRVAQRTADLTAANTELARAARLKDEFLANMSHELRTPLNGILGYAELLQEGIYGTLSPEQSASVAEIGETGHHLLNLINDILDLSKVEAGKIVLEPIPVNLMDLGQMVTRMVSQPALFKRINVISTYDSYAETMVADERRLKQILVNLLGNAVKFTPEGGSVGLEVRVDSHEGTITFTVWDSGIGIAPDDQRRIFEPFIQLDSALHRAHEGTGLGLALVRRLVTLHGGSLSLESTVGVGSRFQVTLPWVLPATSTLQLEPTGLEPGAIRQALLIEDSAIAARQIAYHLQELGTRVVIYQRAEGVIEVAATLQPDVILLDILLPEPVGWDVLRALKADPRTTAIPVVVVSVVDEPAEARALGADAVLLKPITREQLIQTLGMLPLPTQPPPSALVLAPADETTRPVVLLAEDNLVNIRVLESFLTAVGYRVVVAQNGAEAVAQTLDLRPAIVLMDIQMPVLDGLEAIRRIRASGLTELPIIAVTALAMPGDRERCLEAGANDYFAKPVGLRRLREAMVHLFARPA